MDKNIQNEKQKEKTTDKNMESKHGKYNMTSRIGKEQNPKEKLKEKKLEHQLHYTIHLWSRQQKGQHTI